MNLHKTTGRRRLGFALSLLTAILWGILPIFLKTLLNSMDAYTLTWYRFLIAAVLLFIFVWLRNGLPSRESLKGPVLFLFVIAAFSLCSNYLLFLLGLNHLSPSTATVIIQLAPVFMLLGGLFVFKETFSGRQWVGFAVLFFGLACFFNHRLGELLYSLGSYTIGVLLIVAAAVTWAIYALVQKQLLSIFPSTTIMFVIYLSGALLFFPFSEAGILFQLTSFQLFMLGFATFNTIIAYGCFSEALNHWEASRVGAVLSTAPLITLGAMTCLREKANSC
jgi:drug/metabolite transporter (DMT)-like permease